MFISKILLRQFSPVTKRTVLEAKSDPLRKQRPCHPYTTVPHTFPPVTDPYNTINNVQQY